MFLFFGIKTILNYEFTSFKEKINTVKTEEEARQQLQKYIKNKFWNKESEPLLFGE